MEAVLNTTPRVGAFKEIAGPTSAPLDCCCANAGVVNIASAISADKNSICVVFICFLFSLVENVTLWSEEVAFTRQNDVSVPSRSLDCLAGAARKWLWIIVVRSTRRPVARLGAFPQKNDQRVAELCCRERVKSRRRFVFSWAANLRRIDKPNLGWRNLVAARLAPRYE